MAGTRLASAGPRAGCTVTDSRPGWIGGGTGGSAGGPRLTAQGEPGGTAGRPKTMTNEGRRVDPAGRARGAAAQVALTVLVAGAAAGLAACGSAAPGGAAPGSAASGRAAAGRTASGGQPAGGRFCAAARAADRVVASPGPGRRALLPGAITITDAAQVRALAAAVCALPAMPSGLHCPAEVRGTVQLVFAAGGRDLPPVRIQDSGCRSVTGIGRTRWWARSGQFHRLLIRAISGRGRLTPRTHPSSVPTA